jgi:hypothetical protein
MAFSCRTAVAATDLLRGIGLSRRRCAIKRQAANIPRRAKPILSALLIPKDAFLPGPSPSGSPIAEKPIVTASQFRVNYRTLPARERREAVSTVNFRTEPRSGKGPLTAPRKNACCAGPKEWANQPYR